MEPISSAAIQQLKSLYPTPVISLPLHPILDHPWYLVAAVAFNAARRPEAVISVYEIVLKDIRAHGNKDVEVDDHVTLVKKIHEALLKASITNGMARAVTTILQLNSAVPKSVLDRLSSPLRPFSDLASQGSQFLKKMFGEVEGAKAQDLIKASPPDIGTFTSVYYGLVLGYSSAVSTLETSYALIAAGILDDYPREVCWFYLAALRQGATIDQTKAVREMALKAASLSKFALREKVPEVVAKDLIKVY
ncbi:hypothetical protein ONZ45_g15878 [Pleurotus djamor]|nr:hypothetical protein ONZ45_g15878 [Pleurotus djamor]